MALKWQIRALAKNLRRHCFEVKIGSFHNHNFNIFRPYINMEGKSYTQRVCVYVYLPLENVLCPTVLNSFFFVTNLYQICRRMRLKYEGFSNTYAIFLRRPWFYKKKTCFFCKKIGKGGEFAVESVLNDISFQKCLFST